MKRTTIALVGTGLDTYWGQFEGLLEKLTSYQSYISDKIAQQDVCIINTGIIDNVEKARLTGDLLVEKNVDILFLYIATYSLSSTILPIIQKLNKPVIILNLQPSPGIDIDAVNSLKDKGAMTGLWLQHCQACSVPEVCAILNRTGIQYDIVTGYLSDQEAWKTIKQYISAIQVKKNLQNSRLGILGHYYNGMLDVYTDITLQQTVFGCHFDFVEMCELKEYRDRIGKKDISDKIQQFETVFEVSADCEEKEIFRAARTASALDRLISTHKLDGMAYYYEGVAGNEYEDIMTSVIAGNTILTANNIPVAGECEVKNLIAMKILSLLGAGGSFAEFYALDFEDDIVLLGHDGPAHIKIAEGNVGLIPLPVYHGKPGRGLSIQMSVKQGPVTILSVVESKEGVSLLVAEGESVAGKTLQIGNTNSRYRFPVGAKRFINEWSKAGPSHHCAIGIGHYAAEIEKLGMLLSIPVKRIC